MQVSSAFMCIIFTSTDSHYIKCAIRFRILNSFANLNANIFPWEFSYRYKINLHSFIHSWIYSPLLGPGLFFYFEILSIQTIGLIGGVMSLSQGRYLHTGQHKQNKRIHRHPCFWAGFKPTIPAFERAKTVHALDRAASVNMIYLLTLFHILNWYPKENKHCLINCF
jgi:hypothetical protein